jgi:phytol kinase
MVEFLTAADAWRCVGFLTGLALLWVGTGILKERGIGSEGDIRKVNHIAAFAGGAILFGWLPEPVARGSLYLLCPIILLMVGVVCRFRERVPFRHAFAANTRRSDAPHQAVYFWSSWLISILALLAIDLTFGSMKVTRVAALIVGLADGIAEPVGRRWGRHRYRVASLWGAPTSRSIEGSTAVFVATLAVTLGCFSTGEAGGMGWLGAVLGIALSVTLVEAVSPRGSDNFTVPLAAAGLTHLFLAAGWVG